MIARGHIAVAVAAAIGCGGGRAPVIATPEPAPAGTERLLAMLPQGAQVVIEVDLARLRANPVVGAVVTRALADRAAPGGADAASGGPAAAWLRDALRGSAADSPLAAADQIALAAYGVGTAQAATLTVLAAPHDIAGATRVAAGVYALGPPEWVEQVEQRIALAGATGGAGLRAAPELLALRAHAMPAEAPGASLRMTAQLSFDARIALARQTGLDVAPAQISAWGDVADDLALIVDCDASDPGNPAGGGRRGDPSRRLAATLRTVLAGVAELPAIRRLGLPSSLEGARLIARGSWVRAIVAVGPAHLHRVVERAATLLGAPAPGGPPS